ncbi:MAG: metallophosphoesterase [Chitinophagaceae bacterium]|nr:metallophosphoesterase [Chitinophagaceae bacterium]
MITKILTVIPFSFLGYLFPIVFQPSMTDDHTLHDGPYVLYRNNQVFVHYVKPDGAGKKVQVDSFPMTDRKKITLDVATDEPGKTFKVQFRDKLSNEKSDHKKVSRQYVISDIEGNFAGFRKLLLAGKVIDENYNWTFGDGHLVLIGDFVDRGDQVTEVLWLIYALEEKARAAGGYVHYVLGNHEIMVMSGDHRYVNPKYADNAARIGIHLMTLYGADTEIGRWLRTKNVIEKVGGTLYVHGGISRKVNNMDINMSKLNDLARPFYADTTYMYPDAYTDTLYQDYGPFWYRGYFVGETATAARVIDSTFEKFRVNKVVVGHTPIRDTVSAWYDGRLINVDTPHAKGKSEALLVEGSAYFRVKPDGTRIPLGN